MKNNILSKFIIFFGVILFFAACDKHIDRPSPTLTFVSGLGLIDRDTTAPSGETLPVRLSCKWNGTDQLKTLTIYYNQYPTSYLIPDSVYRQGTINLNLYKSSEDKDSWIFEIGDVNGQKAYIGFLVRKDKTGGQIVEYKNITIGAQANTGVGSFYTFSNNNVYNLTNASANQNLIDIVLGYDDQNKTYFASPAADLTGEYDLSAWTVKNSTMYCLTDLKTVQFDNVESDLILIKRFNTSTQNEKAKDLANGDIYSFKLKNNKLGLLKINNGVTGKDGYINFDVKIQK